VSYEKQMVERIAAVGDAACTAEERSLVTGNQAWAIAQALIAVSKRLEAIQLELRLRGHRPS